jgi:hypothetical protein
MQITVKRGAFNYLHPKALLDEIGNVRREVGLLLNTGSSLVLGAAVSKNLIPLG